MSSLTSLDSSLFVSKSESTAKAQTSQQSNQGRYGIITHRNFLNGKSIPKFSKEDTEATSLEVTANGTPFIKTLNRFCFVG